MELIVWLTVIGSIALIGLIATLRELITPHAPRVRTDPTRLTGPSRHRSHVRAA